MQKLIQTGAMDISDAVNAQAIYDIEFLSHRLNSHSEMSSLPRLYGFGVRTVGDIAQMALSAGCTASLCGYRQTRGVWQYQATKRNSERGADIVASLDKLRAAFMLRQHSLDGLAAIPKMSRLVSAMALLGLSLDAVIGDLEDSYLQYAGLPYLTSDTVRDAGRRCETFFAVSEDKTKRRKLTGNISRAGLITDIRPAPKRRLTANPAKIGATS